MLGYPNVLWWNWFCYFPFRYKALVKEKVMGTKELKEWRCNECGREVISSEEPNPITWTNGHVCSFSECKEPCFSELDPACHMDTLAEGMLADRKQGELGDIIKHWPDV